MGRPRPSLRAGSDALDPGGRQRADDAVLERSVQIVSPLAESRRALRAGFSTAVRDVRVAQESPGRADVYVRGTWPGSGRYRARATLARGNFAASGGLRETRAADRLRCTRRDAREARGCRDEDHSRSGQL